MTLALAEPGATAILLAVFGLLMACSVFLSRTLDRFGVPVVLLFLVLGMLGGSESIGGVAFDNYQLAFRIGTIALVLILFDGGLNTRATSIRRSALPAGILATLGVAGTAGILALIARLLGLPWQEALLIGAIVSSTDAAAVFAVLRGGSLKIKDRVRSVLELESCVNDPMAVILTVAMIESISAASPSPWNLIWQVPLELIIGSLVGVAVGFATRGLFTRTAFRAVGLYPVATLASAFMSYGVATLAGGSGFLAVFAAGAILGNGPLPYRSGLARVHDAVAWMAQISMFLMLGLLVFPSKLLPVAEQGLILGLALAFLARPIVAALCLLPFRWPIREVFFTGWVGLRGAVPIILATFPVLAGIPGAERIFHVVFFIVVVSALLPGASIVPLTRKLRLGEREPPTPAAALEMHSLQQLGGSIRPYHIDPTAAVCGATFSQIAFPPGASAILIVRGKELLAAKGNTRIEADDHVYIFFRPEDEPFIGLLFGHASQ